MKTGRVGRYESVLQDWWNFSLPHPQTPPKKIENWKVDVTFAVVRHAYVWDSNPMTSVIPVQRSNQLS